MDFKFSNLLICCKYLKANEISYLECKVKYVCMRIYFLDECIFIFLYKYKILYFYILCVF